MGIPLLCRHCGKMNMVDLQHLEERPLDQVKSEAGYVCKKCGQWEVVNITTTALERTIANLERMPKGRRFAVEMSKAMRKAKNLRNQ